MSERDPRDPSYRDGMERELPRRRAEQALTYAKMHAITPSDHGIIAIASALLDLAQAIRDHR